MAESAQGWDDRTLPLSSERVIAAMPASHLLVVHGSVRWPNIAVETLLLPKHGPRPEIEQLLATRLNGGKAQRIVMQDAGLNRMLSLVNAERGILLMLEGGAGLRFDDIVFREVHDGDRQPSRQNFGACWSGANKNASLASFLHIFRE